MTRCQGCDDERETRTYLVTFHSGKQERVQYCDDCADLARIDWNGETRSCEPVTTEPTNATK